jgi:3-hexulose-6-phosphate synthase/6-phospho-3-hexuloisomerase
MEPVLQLALDFVNLEQALRAAHEAFEGGARWIEAGTPLIKSEGLDAVRALRREFPEATIVADMKVMDAGPTETECAAKAGADVVHVLGAASDSTIIECVEAARRYDARVNVDLVGLGSPERIAQRAGEAEAMGAAYVCIHTPIDLQMRGELPFDDLRAVAAQVGIPVAVAGGINSETAADAIEAGAAIVIVGGAITKSPDATEATRTILKAIATGTRIETDFFKRGDEAGIGAVLARTSAADVTEALHNTGALEGIRPVVQGAKMVGRALTVWTYPGDWAKPVQAIDQAEAGQVLVIDAGRAAGGLGREGDHELCPARPGGHRHRRGDPRRDEHPPDALPRLREADHPGGRRAEGTGHDRRADPHRRPVRAHRRLDRRRR